MANHGAKFVSVNLNKSYGQHHHPSHHSHYSQFSGGGGGGSYGQAAAAGRVRGGGGGGGGMVVLSRGRGGVQKVASKLSVPPPLNLPSLRKEHEKFDMSGPGGAGSGAGTGSGSRPSSSGVGWTKPVATAAPLLEKNDSSVETLGIDGITDTVGASRGGIGSYMPPSARSTGVGPTSASRDSLPSSEKAMLLRGEDFPSLQAARPVSSGASQKQKDVVNQKHKQVVQEELSKNTEESYHLGPMADVHPMGQSYGSTDRSRENGGRVGGRMADQTRKQEEYFPDPLPLVRMNPRLDWADDERDTGHGFVDRGRDTGYSNNDSYWYRDFDLPRPSVPPHKPALNQYDRRGQRDNETGKNFSSEVLKMDPYNKDLRAPSREGKEFNNWRTSPLSKDGFSSQEMGNNRVDVGARMASNNNMLKENKYSPPHYGDTVRDGNTMVNRDSAFGRWDSGHVGQQMQRNSSTESFNNRGVDRSSRDRHIPEQPHRYRADNFQNNSSSKPSLASSGRRPPTDNILGMGRNKRFSNSDRSFVEDPFVRDFDSAGFDERDIFSDGLVEVIKRKKDAAKSTDFHDPVRESFEAELERVQKMQELERQRVIEEQERALEQARREEEERDRRVREEEDRQRRVEEEAREATWRAEQEQLEALRRAEDQRIAREEEKKIIFLEEERRKQAAKQMLQELEAKMARKQTEGAKEDVSASKKTTVDEKMDAVLKENHLSRSVDLDNWEDGERMVENVTSSGPFEPYAHNSRAYPSRESSSNSLDRGKSINSWKRDMENVTGLHSPLSEQETGHFSPRREAIGPGRAGPRKEFHGGAGYMPSRAYLKGGVQESYSDEFGYQKDQRWNLSGNADSFGKFREMDSEFPDIADRYGDNGWGQGRTRSVTTRQPYQERLYPNSPNSEANNLYAYGRSRYSMRQPRVLPPPSLASAQRPNFRGVGELSGPSSFLDNGIHYTNATRTGSARQTDYYGNNHVGLEPSEIFGLQQENSTCEGQQLKNGSRCDSQSSLSVSSPPTSPPHLSHDELDESADSLVTSAVAEGKRNLLTGTGSGSVADEGNSGNSTMMIATDSVSAIDDEEWALENDDPMQQQEEYDEDEDGYREEDEVRERDHGNALDQKFDRLELEEGDSPHVMDNVVLGFDEGVEVVIPSDDIEKNIGDQERSFGIQDGSVGIMEEKEIADGFEQNLLTTDDSQGVSGDSSCGKVPEKSGSIGGAPYSEAPSDLLDGAQKTVDVTSVSNQATNLPVSSSAENQGDLPIKLQFGLFSGPSLIPSPVPAIQIGSIQMPLHIHPPIGPSITHMHPSQFQFGQLRYTSPISQGILPMGPQPLSFLQPNMLGHINMNQNVNKDEKPHPSINNQPNFVSSSLQQSDGSLSFGLTIDTHDSVSAVHLSSSGHGNEKLKSGSGFQLEEKGRHHAASRSTLPAPKVQSMMPERNSSGPRGLGPSSGGRGRRFTYAVKNVNTRPTAHNHNMPPDLNGFQRRPRRTVQRTEFRVRDNDRKQAPVPVSSSTAGLDGKPIYTGKAVGVFTRSGSKRSTISNRIMKQRTESEPSASGNIVSQDVKMGDRTVKEIGSDSSIRSQFNSHPDEANLRRNGSEEDVDAPLQSGVVRVFKQSGIEAPSDDDDFIEVRSKRQMLNERREQREKEIKAKARSTKALRKPHVSRQKDVARSQTKHNVPLDSEEPVNPQMDFAASESSHFVSGVSTGASQPPIGTPPSNSETQAIKHSQASPVSAVPDSRAERESGLMFDSKNKVMSLSQTQIDEAMKPARYDSHISAGGHSSSVSDPTLQTSSSILAKDKTYSSGASPISSLLAGEKIQFGAVTSPTVIPPSSRVVSHGIGAPGSNRPDAQASRSFPEKDIFFEKEKHLNDSCALPNCEAEAEAAASAVAVAAISSDENTLGTVNDTKSFTGVVGQSQGEEPLTVSLPADLSVETTPISLWPPLPSPQSSSSQMLSHFPAGPPSHFPFYEMNPLLGGPIYAFSPREESSGGPQPQPPKATPSSSSGPLGNWHSGVDSFYGPPAGYSGPFIGPPGGIQGHPHMVVYNHFAPVGQYGQVGLSFMGTTYIPSGKQADWKSSGASTGMHVGEGDMNNVNMNTMQRSASMTAPIQHLAPGSPLLPMPPSLPMFDVSSFQTASDLPVQARWGHIPASPLHPIPMSRPLQQPQVEGSLPSHPNHQSLTANGFTEPRTQTPSDSAPSFTVAPDTTVAPFPSELGLVDSLRSTAASSGNTSAASGKNDTIDIGKQTSANSAKNQFPKKSGPTQHQQGNISGQYYQRGGSSQRNELPHHRRMGFHGRNHSSGVDKGFPGSKMRQIYVAKQTTSGNSST